MCTFTSPLSPAQGRLVSRYGVRRGIRPPHLPTFHAGLDLGISGAPVGTVPVYCVAAGTVELVGSNDVQDGPLDGYGNCIAIRHDGGFWSFYAHQDHLAASWARGQAVPAGTVLGYVGATSNGKFHIGPHLHFEVRHAASGGASPYPGPYPRLTPSGGLSLNYNVDPMPWLAARGVTFGRRGVIVLTPPLACDPSAFAQLALR